MVTLCSAALGAVGGVLFALGEGFLAGCSAALGQILDGVDGQLARLTGREAPEGAFWDSVLDRYSDGALVIGMIVYCAQNSHPLAPWLVILLGAAAVIGSGQISYTTARADALGLYMGPPTLASKGTRTSVIIMGGWSSAIWSQAPLVVLAYLVIHPNWVVMSRLRKAWKLHKGTSLSHKGPAGGTR